VQVAVAAGGFEKIFEDGSSSDFSALQFHFHAPSENTIDGKHMDLEMHIVHKYAGTDPAKYGAVLGFMFDMEHGGPGKNHFIDQVTKVFANGSAPGANVSSEVWLEGFIDAIDTERFWSFDGSLTTPPCSEGIKWTVFEQIQPISADQLKKFTDLWAGNPNYAEGKGNNRVVQPLNSRTLHRVGGPKPKSVSDETLVIVSVLLGFSMVGLIALAAIVAYKPSVLGLHKGNSVQVQSAAGSQFNTEMSEK